MLDKKLLPYLNVPFSWVAKILFRAGVSANSVTLIGFIIGLSSLLALAWQYYLLALTLILLSRLCDGLDGNLARLTQPSERGAFLDISCDFIFYSAVPFGFALANPSQNALAACALIFSFVGSGTSFLSFAILAQKCGIHCRNYPNKGFYYLGGLTEASETLACFALMCIFPNYFSWFAWVFAFMCMLTTLSRIALGWVAFGADK